MSRVIGYKPWLLQQISSHLNHHHANHEHFEYSILLVILLKYVIASEKIMTKKYVIEALEEKGFVSIQRDWGKWKYCNDLFDHLITRNLDFIVGFLNQIKDAKNHTCCTAYQET